MGGQQSRRRSKSRNSVTSIADIIAGGDDFEQRSRAATEVVPSGGAAPAETAKHGRSKSVTKAKSKDKEKKGSKSNIATSPSITAAVTSASGAGAGGVGEDSNIARPDDIKVRFAEEKSASRASAAVTSPASALSPTSATSATSAPSPSPSADGIPTSSPSPPPGDREPEGDKEEVIFDVPELDEESLFAFAHGMQLTCAGDGQIPKLPNLKAIQASVKGMDLIRKIKFRQTGDDTISRDDLIAPVTALFVALSMEKAKITDFDIAGVPAATNLVKQLAAAIKSNRPLYSLGVHLSRTALSTTVAAVATDVCSALQFNTKLVSLDLSFTPLGPQDGAILADLINYNTSLMSLSLKKCRLGVCGPNIAVMMQSNTSLTELDLTGNEMGDVGGRAIAGALVANQTLLRLWLDENNLTAVTIQDLSKSLSINRTLTSLSLRENDLNVSGGSAISTILRMNSTLRHLDLNGCNLGILGAKWIAKSLEANKSLTSLHVAYNDLAYDGAVEILKSLRANIKLSCLDITGNKIGTRGEKTVRSLIKANKKITTLLAAHNQFSDKFYAKLYEKLEENSDNRIGLSVKPRTLAFPIQFGRMVDIKTHFFITNTSDNWLCFSVSSNAEHVQGLYPSTGFLKPRATVAIIVQLNGRFHAEYCRHVILLRTSTIRKAEHLKRPPREYWRVTKTSKEKHHACTYIRCEFTAPDDRQEWSPMQVEEGDPLYLTVRQAEQRRSTTANRWMTLAGDKKRPMGAIAVDSEELVALRREVERLRGLLDQYRRKGRGGDGEGGIGGNGDGTFDVSNIFGGGGDGDSDSDGEGLLDDDGEEVDTLMSARRRKLRRERKRREGDDDDGLDLLDSDVELDSDDDFGDGGGGGGGGRRGRGRGGKGKGGGKGDGYGSGSGDEDGLGGGGSKRKGGAGADLASELALKKRSSTELEKPPEEMVIGGGPDAPPMAPPMGDIPMAPGMGPVGPPPKKSRYKPTVPMRKFYWQVIMPLNVEETLWKDIDDYPIDLDQPEFETYFAVKAIEKKVKEKTEEELAAEEEKKRLEAEKVRFIDAKRAFNLEVTLSRFKISYESIRDAMLTMDQTVLTEEKIETLLKFAPTDQELKDVTSYKGDPSKLGNSEQFFRCIAVIPRIRNRLELFLFRLQFPEAMDTIEGELKMVEDALEQVKSSIHLRTILTIILAFGNFMNHGTKNGGAFGYQLSTLGKLRDIRSTDNKSTLLHYLVTYVQKNKPSAGNFVKELSGVKMASKVEASNMVYQVGKVTKFCNKLKSELDLFKDEASRGIRRDGDQFIHTMDAFFENSIGRIKSLSQRQAKADKQINELISLYGGDPKIMKWEQFFGFFDNFTSDYQATEQFLEAVRLREEADARKAIADAQRKQETAIKKAAKKAAYEEKKREREAAEARGELLPDSEYSSPVVTPRERAVAFVEDNGNGNEGGSSEPGSEQPTLQPSQHQQQGEASPTSPGTGDDEDEEDWG